MSAIHSSSLDVNGKRLHFLSSGEGPVILLCHASPMNAVSLMPLMSELSDNYTVIALDTPGYGKSERPDHQPRNLSTYDVQIVDALRTGLNISTLGLYGTATGAQIAVRYGIEYPENVDYIFLDNVAHFAPEMADQVMDDYFPDLTPQKDGSHLPILWDNVVNLFKYFPWCWKEAEYQLTSPMPPLAILHHVALLYLKAGKEYDWAYRAAFEHERREYIAELKVPTTIIRWDLSIVKAYTDKIFEIELPSNVADYKITAEQDRYKMIATHIQEVYKGQKSQLKEFERTPFQKTTANSNHVFPTPEITGAYLMDAWQQHVLKFEGDDITSLSSSFNQWAEST